jgi:hypothetical protein
MRPTVRYTVQFWTKHFVNCDWFQALQDAAVDDLRDRTFDVREYGFRSRLFHGDIPIMNSFNEDDVNFHPGRYDVKVEYYTLALQLMLLAVIWKAIQTDSVNLSFFEKAKFC